MLSKQKITMEIALIRMAPDSDYDLPEQGSMDQTLKESLGITYFELVKILSRFEKKYGITIKLNELDALKTLEDLVVLIQEKCKEKL